VACGHSFPVPSMHSVAHSIVLQSGDAGNQPVAEDPAWRFSSLRCAWMMLAQLPLVYFTFNPVQMNFNERLNVAVQSMSEQDRKRVVDYVKTVASSEGEIPKTAHPHIFELLPTHRLPGAVFGYRSWDHWWMAVVSLVGFLILLAVLFRSPMYRMKHVIGASVFTGSAGILMLLLFQSISLRRNSLSEDVSYALVKELIAFSYTAALDPRSGFGWSLVGFTFGVGLCEEVCKLIPLYWNFRKKRTLDWSGAFAWGFASGAGFGVSEGVFYGFSFYNGYSTAEVYWVRFVSCVALHAIWSGTAGVSLWKRQDQIQKLAGRWSAFFTVVSITFWPMFLHGLYDTFLKKNMQWEALATALLSVFWMAWSVETATRYERKLDVVVAV